MTSANSFVVTCRFTSSLHQTLTSTQSQPCDEARDAGDIENK